MKKISFALRLILGLILLTALVSKAFNLSEFLSSIVTWFESYLDFTEADYIYKVVGILFLIVELYVIYLLILKGNEAGYFLGGGLFLIFIIYNTFNLLADVEECYCFGNLFETKTTTTLILDIVMLVMIMTAWQLDKFSQQKSTSR